MHVTTEVYSREVTKQPHLYTIITFMQEDMTLYGVDWNGPFPDAEEVDQVYVEFVYRKLN